MSLLSLLLVYISVKAVKIKTDTHFLQDMDNDKTVKLDLSLKGRIISLGLTAFKSYLINNL